MREDSFVLVASPRCPSPPPPHVLTRRSCGSPCPPLLHLHRSAHRLLPLSTAPCPGLPSPLPPPTSMRRRRQYPWPLHRPHHHPHRHTHITGEGLSFPFIRFSFGSWTCGTYAHVGAPLLFGRHATRYSPQVLDPPYQRHDERTAFSFWEPHPCIQHRPRGATPAVW